jgi:hypothetical protein
VELLLDPMFAYLLALLLRALAVFLSRSSRVTSCLRRVPRAGSRSVRTEVLLSVDAVAVCSRNSQLRSAVHDIRMIVHVLYSRQR